MAKKEGTRTVEVNGAKVEVDIARLESWKAFKMLAEIEEAEDSFGKVMACLGFMEYITGLGEDDIVALNGGEDAKVQDVVGFAMAVIQGAYPKN